MKKLSTKAANLVAVKIVADRVSIVNVVMCTDFSNWCCHRCNGSQILAKKLDRAAKEAGRFYWWLFCLSSKRLPKRGWNTHQLDSTCFAETDKVCSSVNTPTVRINMTAIADKGRIIMRQLSSQIRLQNLSFLPMQLEDNPLWPEPSCIRSGARKRNPRPCRA